MTMQWRFVELFAGKANVSTSFRQHGYQVCSLDLEIGGDTMNFCKPAGFLSGPRDIIGLASTLRLAVYACMRAGGSIGGSQEPF